MRASPRPSSRFLLRFVPLMAALLFPWPGLAQWFTSAFVEGCNTLAGVDLGLDSQVLCSSPYGPEHPSWMQVSVTNVLTGRSLLTPVDTRTIVYIRLAVFLALALALPVWKTRQGLKATGLGFALLVAAIACTVAIPLLQALGMVGVLPLGTRANSFLSIGTLMLMSYPSMAFAIPGLIWLLTMRLAGPAGDIPLWRAFLGAGDAGASDDQGATSGARTTRARHAGSGSPRSSQTMRRPSAESGKGRRRRARTLAGSSR